MLTVTIQLPEELLPALKAEFLLLYGTNPPVTIEEYFAGSVVEFIRQRAEIHKVGPYFKGAVEPRFLKDGRGNPKYIGDDAAPYYVIYPKDNNGTPWSPGDIWKDENTEIYYKYTEVNQTFHWEVIPDYFDFK